VLPNLAVHNTRMTPPPTLDAAHLHLSRDPVMAGLIELHGPLPPLVPATDPFAALVRAVLGQQLSVKAAAAIALRLDAALHGSESPAPGYDPARLLALPPETLRGLGLSWAKVRTVRAAAESHLSGQIDFAHLNILPDEKVMAALLPLPGIGRWTAEMFLMFSLARPDVFSLGDLGLRRGLEHFYPALKAQEADTQIAEWAPHRTLAARYLWLARP
jgi:DNA-3-methyladenine glycosylase II